MNNYMLINQNDINPDQPEFFGAECSEYAVTNLAWNRRIAQLLDEEEDNERALDPFVDYMARMLDCEHIQDIRYCDLRDTYLFTAMYF
jgi:hypothetical protein